MSAQYFSEELGPDGVRRQTVRTGVRGEVVTLPLTEASRLDALGALAPEGATVEDIQRDLDSTYEAYQSARRNAPEGV